METVRQAGQFKLNFSPQTGMFNVTNEILLRYTKDKGVSYWFDKDTAESLLIGNDREFADKCKQRAGNDIYCLDVLRGLWKEFLEEAEFDENNCLSRTWYCPHRSFFSGTEKSEIISWFSKQFGVDEKFK